MAAHHGIVRGARATLSSQARSKGQAEGTVGKGGAVLALETFSGRIRVKPAS
jgi:hypothetical protein